MIPRSAAGMSLSDCTGSRQPRTWRRPAVTVVGNAAHASLEGVVRPPRRLDEPIANVLGPFATSAAILPARPLVGSGGPKIVRVRTGPITPADVIARTPTVVGPGMPSADQVDGVAAIPGLADDADPGLFLEDGSEARPDQRLIVGNQDFCRVARLLLFCERGRNGSWPRRVAHHPAGSRPDHPLE